MVVGDGYYHLSVCVADTPTNSLELCLGTKVGEKFGGFAAVIMESWTARLGSRVVGRHGKLMIREVSNASRKSR